MTDRDKELFEDEDNKIYIDWEQILFEVILLVVFTFILWLACSIGSQAKEPIYVTYQQAGCNVTRYLLMNIEADEVVMANFDAQQHTAVDEIINEFNERQAERAKLNRDIDLLAHLIWNEVGILGEQAMYYCGSVVLNRMNSSIYPDTLEGVIYQRGQYEITWNGMISRPTPQRAYEIARDLLENGSVLPSNVLFQAEFTQGAGVYAKIGNTYFCYMR